MTNLIDYTLLVAGFAFTFFVPGFLIIESFWADLPRIQKFPLYLALSVIISTYLVYVVSLVLGFSRETLVLIIAPFFIWFIWFVFRKKVSCNFYKGHWLGFGVALLIMMLFFIALYPAIFALYKNYFVMASVNWQDTAMHQSIISSISQGNFPPQAPYYAGVPLSYYYFTDFHSGILVTLFARFFPRILVYDNPFFVFLFATSLYALAFSFTKKKTASILAILFGVFWGNFIWINFFKDLLDYNFLNVFLTKIPDLLSHGSYTVEFNGIFQVSPMADYFLQNRPAMFGLPAFALVLMLLIGGFKKNDLKRIVLAGFIAGSMLRFQLFAFVVSYLALVPLVFVNLRKNIGLVVKNTLAFVLPSLIFAVFLFEVSANGNSALTMFGNNFRWGQWEKKDLWWNIKFVLVNFNFPFILMFLGLKFKKNFFLFLLTTLLFVIPFIITFTIFGRDMFKFFYFMVVPMSVLAGIVASKFLKIKVIGVIICVSLLIASSLTSILTLGSSVFNKAAGYSKEDLKAALWVRDKVPQGAVFATLPTVRNPVADLAGRLRVISYINWPYSHGYNFGDDNVFVRANDMENLYRSFSQLNLVSELSDKYNFRYIYYGPEERGLFPGAQISLEDETQYKKIYNSGDIQIYEVR